MGRRHRLGLRRRGGRHVPAGGRGPGGRPPRLARRRRARARARDRHRADRRPPAAARSGRDGHRAVGGDGRRAPREGRRRRRCPWRSATWPRRASPGEFALVYLVFNTITNLRTQAEQVACFRNAAAHLAPGGRFVVEVYVPPLRRLPPGQVAVPFDVSEAHTGFDTFDLVTQQSQSHHYTRTADGSTRYDVGSFRYVWPAELDLMAQLAGMGLERRTEDWAARRSPPTARSTCRCGACRPRQPPHAPMCQKVMCVCGSSVREAMTKRSRGSRPELSIGHPAGVGIRGLVPLSLIAVLAVSGCGAFDSPVAGRVVRAAHCRRWSAVPPVRGQVRARVRPGAPPSSTPGGARPRREALAGCDDGGGLTGRRSDRRMARAPARRRFVLTLTECARTRRAPRPPPTATRDALPYLIWEPDVAASHPPRPDGAPRTDVPETHVRLWHFRG